MTALRRPRPWVSRADYQAALAALDAARDQLDRDRQWVVDYLTGLADAHELDARRRDGPTTIKTSNSARVLTGDDHRLIAWHLRAAARDFREAR